MGYLKLKGYFVVIYSPFFCRTQNKIFLRMLKNVHKITGVQNNMSVIFSDILENNFFHRTKESHTSLKQHEGE